MKPDGMEPSGLRRSMTKEIFRDTIRSIAEKAQCWRQQQNAEAICSLIKWHVEKQVLPDDETFSQANLLSNASALRQKLEDAGRIPKSDGVRIRSKYDL